MDAERWLASELASFDCAACGQAYGQGRIRLIAQREELYFVDLACDHCGSQAVAIVTIQLDEAGPSDALAVTLPGNDAEDVPARPAISVDDVLDAHALLEGFEGDAHQLVARLGGKRR